MAVPGELRARLEGLAYERCLAVMAVLDGPAGIPAPGFVAPDAGPIAWLADNQAKGVSAVMPASSIANVLAQPACPSTRRSQPTRI